MKRAPRRCVIVAVAVAALIGVIAIYFFSSMKTALHVPQFFSKTKDTQIDDDRERSEAMRIAEHLCERTTGNGQKYTILREQGIVCFDPQNYQSGSSRPISGAHADTFEILEVGEYSNARGKYARDDVTVYYDGKVISGANAKNFRRVSEFGDYWVDGQRVYSYGVVREGVDGATFSVLTRNWSRTASKVYFQDVEVPGANSNHFTTLVGRGDSQDTSMWGADNGDVYYGDTPLSTFMGMPINPQAFTVLSSNYATDGRYVFYKNTLVNDGDSDPKTFKVIEDNIAKDAKFIYCKAAVVLNGPDVATFENGDPDPFDHVIGDSLFFDKKWAYHNNGCDNLQHPLEKNLARFIYNDESLPGVERLGYRMSRYRGKIYINSNGPHALGWNDEISDIDGPTFRILDKFYAIDKNRVYTNFTNSQPTLVTTPSYSFVSLGSGYGASGNTVFFGANVIAGIDRRSAKISGDFIVDENSAWLGVERVDGSDAQTFVGLGDDYGKDVQNVYWETTAIEDADSQTFHKADTGYIETPAAFWRSIFFADKNHVFYDGKIVDYSFDAPTFLAITRTLAKDRNGVYNISEIRDGGDSAIAKILDADPASIVGLSPIYAKDNAAIYCGDQRNANVDITSFRVHWKPFNPETGVFIRVEPPAEDKDAFFNVYTCQRQVKKTAQ